MKVILFTHGSDIDGLGCVILARLAISNLDYVLCSNPNELEMKVRELYETEKLYSYDKIYITDLALNEPVLSTIAKDEILSKKIEIFDHHKSAIDSGLNKYDFTHIHVEVDGIHTCGTELFYKYLINSNYLEPTKLLDEFVELTRLEDTWEWKNDPVNGEKAWNLAVLLSILDTSEYIETIFQKLISSSNSFEYTSEELELIYNKKQEDARVVKSMWSEAEFMCDEEGNKIAVILGSCQYIGELSEYIRKVCNNIKYFILIDLDKEPLPQRSYRSIDEDFDVCEVAKRHGGGGHKGASGALISLDDKNKALDILSKNKIEGLKYLINIKYNS